MSCSFVNSPFIVPLGVFAMVSIIVWVTTQQKTREKELAHELRVRELAHEQRMKELEIERLRLQGPEAPKEG